MEYVEYTLDMLRELDLNIFHVTDPVEKLPELLEEINRVVDNLDDFNYDDALNTLIDLLEPCINSLMYDPQTLHDKLTTYEQFLDTNFKNSSLHVYVKVLIVLLNAKLAEMNYLASVEDVLDVAEENATPSNDYPALIKNRQLLQKHLKALIYVAPVELDPLSKMHLISMIDSSDDASIIEVADKWKDSIDKYNYSTSRSVVLEHLKVISNRVAQKVTDYADNQFELNALVDSIAIDDPLYDALLCLKNKMSSDETKQTVLDSANKYYELVNDAGQNLSSHNDNNGSNNHNSDEENELNTIGKDLIIQNLDNERIQNSILVGENIYDISRGFKDANRDVITASDRAANESAEAGNISSEMDSLNQQINDEFDKILTDMGLTRDDNLSLIQLPPMPGSINKSLDNLTSRTETLTQNLLDSMTNYENSSNNAGSMVGKGNSTVEQVTSGSTWNMNVPGLNAGMNSNYSNALDYSSSVSDLKTNLESSDANLDKLINSITQIQNSLVSSGMTNTLGAYDGIGNNGSMLYDRLNLAKAPLMSLKDRLKNLLCRLLALLCMIMSFLRGLYDAIMKILALVTKLTDYDALKKQFEDLLGNSQIGALAKFIFKVQKKEKEKWDAIIDAVIAQISAILGPEKAALFLQAYKSMSASCTSGFGPILTSMAASYFNDIINDKYNELVNAIKQAMGIFSFSSCSAMSLLPSFNMFNLRLPTFNFRLKIPSLGSLRLSC